MIRTTILMTVLTLLMVFIGDYFGGESGMLVMLIISFVSNFFMYWNSDKMVIAQYQATPVDANSHPEIYDIVAQLAAKGNLPMPKVYVINSAVPNAFATGRNPEHAAVCVTTGLMNTLSPKEISGVLGHELSHVKHGDILLGSVVASMAGVISMLARFAMFFGGGRRDDNNRNPLVGLLMLILAPMAAMLIQLAISRSREYMADHSGGALCGDPDALADALTKIEAIASQRTLPNATENTAHMFIISPFSAQDAKALFSTHPPTAERIKRLREEAQEIRQGEKIDFA
jgi:heat shock protein HtpX